MRVCYCTPSLSTVNADLDWNDLVKHLRVNGKLCLVGVPHKPVSFNIGPLIGCQGSVCASLIGSRASIPDMLRFAMLHNIKYVTACCLLVGRRALLLLLLMAIGWGGRRLTWVGVVLCLHRVNQACDRDGASHRGWCHCCRHKGQEQHGAVPHGACG